MRLNHFLREGQRPDDGIYPVVANKLLTPYLELCASATELRYKGKC